MSILTPTSRYWNCVLTRGLIPTPPIPGWKDPVATGTRSPIFSEAFCPSEARIWGFWMMRVLASLNRKFAVAPGMVTVKFVAWMLARSFRLIWLGVPVVVPEVGVPLVVGVVLVAELNATDALAGG